MNNVHWTYIDHKFRINYDLLLRVIEAKKHLEPSKERDIRLNQLFNHSATCIQ
jgi:hypothetical protein